MNKRDTWKARQKFVQSVRRACPTFAKIANSCRHDCECYIRNYIQSFGTEREYYWRYYEMSHNAIAHNLKPVQVCKWLLTCGLHPYVTDEGKVSFCPKGRKRHKESHRQETSFQKFVSRFAPPEICPTPMQLDSMWAVVREELTPLDVVFVDGPDISVAYNEEVGGHSCMTGPGRQDYIMLYEENPSVVSLAIVGYNLHGRNVDDYGRSEARALIWQTENGIVIDRIYYGDFLFNSASKVLSSIHGALSHKFPDVEIYGYNSRNIPDDTHVKVKAAGNGHWPYCDTFHFVSKQPDAKGLWTLATNDSYFGRTKYTCLDNTDGTGPTSDNRPVCESCGERTDPEDMMECGECQDCYAQHTFTCPHCYKVCEDDSATEVRVARVTWGLTCFETQHWCEHCADSDARRCDACHETFDAEDGAEVALRGSNGDAEYENWCMECRDNDAVECSNCAETCDCGSAEERDGDTYCWICVVEHDAEAAEIEAARHHNPTFVFCFLNILAA